MDKVMKYNKTKQEVFNAYIDGTLNAEEFALELGDYWNKTHPQKGMFSYIITNANVAKILNEIKV